METIRRVVVLDAADPATESRFWAGVVGGHVVDDDDDFHCVIDSAGQWCIGVQRAPNHVAPQWPDGAQQQQVHLDLHVDDIRRANDEVMALGARLLRAAPNLDAEEGHQIYADPAGHPFCVGWGHPSKASLSAFVRERFGLRLGD